jgi:uncharacterized membrane protein
MGFLKLIGIFALAIITILVLLSFTTSDFVQRIKHQTYSNCVNDLTSSMSYSADIDPNAFEYYEKVGGPQNAAKIRCRQLFDVK